MFFQIVQLNNFFFKYVPNMFSIYFMPLLCVKKKLKIIIEDSKKKTNWIIHFIDITM